MTNSKNAAETAACEDRGMELRRTLSSAYAILQGKALSSSMQSFTFEEALDEYIEKVEGAGTRAHPNLQDRVAKVADRVRAAGEAMKTLPTEDFLEPDEVEGAVYSDEEDEE